MEKPVRHPTTLGTDNTVTPKTDTTVGHPTTPGTDTTVGHPTTPGTDTTLWVTLRHPEQTPHCGSPYDTRNRHHIVGHPTTPGTDITVGHPTKPGTDITVGHPTTPGTDTTVGHPTTPGTDTTVGHPTTPGTKAFCSRTHHCLLLLLFISRFLTVLILNIFIFVCIFKLILRHSHAFPCGCWCFWRCISVRKK